MLRLQKSILIALMTITILIPACGGGGGGSTSVGGGGGPQPSSATILYWSTPTKDVAGNPIDPGKDIDSYEIFLNNTGVFDIFDHPVTVVKALDASNNLVTEINLSNLQPPVTFAPKMYVSMRTVSMTGAKSGFSPAVPFDS